MKKLILILASIALAAPIAISQDNGEFKVREQTTKSEKKKKEKKKENEKEESDEKAFGKGTIAVTVGYGFPNMYKALYKAFIVNFNSFNSIYSGSTYAYDVKGFGPAFLKVDYGVNKFIGLGLSVGYFNFNINEKESYQVNEYNSSTGTYQLKTYENTTNYAYSSTSIGARFNFHFGTGEKLDPYVGASAGYSSNHLKLTYSSNNPNTVVTPNYSGVGTPTHFAITVGMRYYFTPNIGIYGELGIEKWSVIQGGIAAKF